MAQTAFSIRMDEGLKQEFSQFCENIGMTMSTAFVVFAKAALRNRKIPFEIYDYSPISEVQTFKRVTSREAVSAFENMRFQVQSQLKDKPEPTIDEINAMIADVRKKRRTQFAH
jgi:addiction module RelB/DinJ family antitoxin